MGPQPQTNPFVEQVLASKEFFERSTRVLEEADSNYRPQPGMMTVAQQIGHTAQTIDWFIEGISRSEGFDLDFAKHAAALESVTSITAARQSLEAAYSNAVKYLSSRPAEQMSAPLPPGPIMGGQPIAAAIGGMVEHTAHHRGALTVYSRMLGKTPIMPYGE